jgi:hypothetical protein
MLSRETKLCFSSRQAQCTLVDQKSIDVTNDLYCVWGSVVRSEHS